jgi:predicted N-formylglutamate amidohydrolase
MEAADHDVVVVDAPARADHRQHAERVDPVHQPHRQRVQPAACRARWGEMRVVFSIHADRRGFLT